MRDGFLKLGGPHKVLLSLFILALLSSAGISSKAEAAVVWENGEIDLTASNAFPTGAAIASLSQEWFGSDTAGIPDAFDRVSFWFKGNTTDTYNLQLYRNYGCSNHSAALVDSTGSFTPTSTDFQNYTLIFTTENTTSTKYCYSLYFEDVAGTDTNRTYISPLNTGAGMNFEAYPGPQTTSSQMYAQFCMTDCGAAEPLLSFSWSDPSYNDYISATYNIAKGQWVNLPTSTYVAFDTYIEISTSSDMSNPFVAEVALSPPTPASSTPSTWTGGIGVWSSNNFQLNLSTTTRVYGEAKLRGINIASTTILATATTSWTFVAHSVYGEGYSTTTDPCNPEVNFIVYGLCRLFAPTQGHFDQFKNLAPYSETKLPFGFSGALQTAKDSFSSSTPTTTLWIVVDVAQSQAPIVNILGWGADIVLSAGYFFWILRRTQNIHA